MGYFVCFVQGNFDFRIEFQKFFQAVLGIPAAYLTDAENFFILILPSIDKDTHASSGLIPAGSASSSIGVRPVRLIPLP